MLDLFNSKEIQEAFKKKVEDSQKEGFVKKDIEFIDNNKRIKLWLPNDVRKQLYLLKLGLSYLNSSDMEFEKAFEIEVKLIDEVIVCCLVDGNRVMVNDLEASDIGLYVLTYLVELILPLSLTGQAKSNSRLKAMLKNYLTV